MDTTSIDYTTIRLYHHRNKFKKLYGCITTDTTSIHFTTVSKTTATSIHQTTISPQISLQYIIPLYHNATHLNTIYLLITPHRSSTGSTCATIPPWPCLACSSDIAVDDFKMVAHQRSEDSLLIVESIFIVYKNSKLDVLSSAFPLKLLPI